MPVSTSFAWTQRRPIMQSREDVHWLWHRLKAQTSGLSHSELMAQPLISGAAGVLSPPQDATTIARAARIEKHVEMDRESFKVPSKLAHVKRSRGDFQAPVCEGSSPSRTIAHERYEGSSSLPRTKKRATR